MVFPPHITDRVPFRQKKGERHKLVNSELLLRILENVCCCYRTGQEDNYMRFQLDFALTQLYAVLSYWIDKSQSEQFGFSSRHVRKYFLQ